jgi:hypothetical protein
MNILCSGNCLPPLFLQPANAITNIRKNTSLFIPFNDFPACPVYRPAGGRQDYKYYHGRIIVLPKFD